MPTNEKSEKGLATNGEKGDHTAAPGYASKHPNSDVADRPTQFSRKRRDAVADHPAVR